MWQVQRQRLVTPSPVVSNSTVPLHDQRRDAQSFQTRGSHQTVLSASYDEHIRLDALQLGVDGSLSVPSVRTRHVPISFRDLGEVVQRFNSRVEIPHPPTFGRGGEGNDRRDTEDVRVEADVGLNKRQVLVRSLDSGRGVDESDIRHRRVGQQVGGRLLNSRLKVERPVVPSEGYTVSPDT